QSTGAGRGADRGRGAGLCRLLHRSGPGQALPDRRPAPGDERDDDGWAGRYVPDPRRGRDGDEDGQGVRAALIDCRRQQKRSPPPGEPDRGRFVFAARYATTRSGTISRPFVSGPRASATTKFTSPNMAPISIGIAKPRFHAGSLAK